MSTTNMILQTIGSFANLILYGGLFIGLTALGSWWYFTIGMRRKWIANVWEVSSEGYYHLVRKDKVIERKIKGKNAHLYVLRKAKYSVPPVNELYVIRYQKKGVIDYLRLGSDYVPMKKLFIQDQVTKTWFAGFEPMPYDIQMQMIATEELTEKMFMAKKDWMNKYGALLGLGMVVVLIIVMMSMYYDFVSNSMGPVKDSVGALQSIAQTIGGSP